MNGGKISLRPLESKLLRSIWKRCCGIRKGADSSFVTKRKEGNKAIFLHLIKR